MVSIDSILFTHAMCSVCKNWQYMGFSAVRLVPEVLKTQPPPVLWGFILSFILTFCDLGWGNSRHLSQGGQCVCLCRNAAAPWQTTCKGAACPPRHTWTGHHGNIWAPHSLPKASFFGHAEKIYLWLQSPIHSLACSIITCNLSWRQNRYGIITEIIQARLKFLIWNLKTHDIMHYKTDMRYSRLRSCCQKYTKDYHHLLSSYTGYNTSFSS